VSDDAISQRGTKTRARSATHSPRLVSAMRCPTCGGRQVLHSVAENARALGAFWCGSCGDHFDDDGTERGANG
jgi:transcription elongation factor Elf1